MRRTPTHPKSLKDAVLSSTELESKLIKAIVEDDKQNLLALATDLHGSSALDRAAVSKLLHLCCSFDSAGCAASLLNGELSSVPLLNDFDEDSRLSPLHASAHALSSRVVELLLKKHARTDLKTRDGRSLIPLELSLISFRAEVTWNPEDGCLKDLIVQLGKKDLTTVKLLSEKTTTLNEVAYASAMGGRVVDLATLLLVASEKVTVSILELHDAKLETKEKTTIYECVIREALALGRSSMEPLRAAKRSTILTESESAQRRKLMLCEIELLQLFGATTRTGGTDKKVASPLIRAAQAGDEAVIELLLKSNIDVNDTDAEGNSALHWCLKTSKASCPHHTKIMWTLLKHGAEVSQKNKLGLTAAHIAAAHGNLEALQLLLLEDPDCIHSRTELKETPLFFSVKNDFQDCTELLLRWGASTEVFNLRLAARANILVPVVLPIFRRQRPTELAVSQDMRFLLNPTHISRANHAHSVKERYATLLQGDEIISETRKEIAALSCEGENNDRTHLNSKVETCRYFESPYGCIRGSKCFYSHTEGRHPKTKKGKDMIHLPPLQDLELKVFVGGLPTSLDSDMLHIIFEEQFGEVDNAVVVGAQTADVMQSRGFGFVTFKDKRSVSAAVDTHHVSIMGKKVEIKSAIPKCILQSESQQSPQAHVSEPTDLHLLEAEVPQVKVRKEISRLKILNVEDEKEMLGQWMPSDKTEKEMPSCGDEEEAKAGLRSWVDKLIRGLPQDADHVSNESQEHEETMPLWLRTFKKWFPHFLQQVSRKGEYALSSLKADFRAAFGLELDHVSLGFTKLSDFMKSIPNICSVKLVPIDKRKPANHMVLLPRRSNIQHPPQNVIVQSPSLHVTSINESSSDNCDDDKYLKDIPLPSNENQASSANNIKVSQGIDSRNAGDTSPSLYSRFVQFLKPDPTFHARTWLQKEWNTGSGCFVDERARRQESKGLQNSPQYRHLVLEALSSEKSNSSVFFMRELFFYNNYKASIMQGKCFGCNRHQVLWANFPCLHPLWCDLCKAQAIQAAGCFEHKCVICDMRVQKMELIPWQGYNRIKCENTQVDDYPPLDLCYAKNMTRSKELQYLVKA